VLGVEREVKPRHITLLISIKNTLSAEQQAKLGAARAGGACGEVTFHCRPYVIA